MAATRNLAAGGPTRQNHCTTPAGRQDAGSLTVVRDELERHPRDPFQVDPAAALDALRLEWGHSHQLAWHEGLYCAQRTGPDGRPHGPVLTGQTPDEIEQELRRDWGEA